MEGPLIIKKKIVDCWIFCYATRIKDQSQTQTIKHKHRDLRTGGRRVVTCHFFFGKHNLSFCAVLYWVSCHFGFVSKHLINLNGIYVYIDTNLT